MLTEQYKAENHILPEDAERIAKGLALGWSEPSRNTLSGRLAGVCPKSKLIDVWPEFAPLPTLRTVQWVTFAQRGYQEMHSDVGSRVHLTESKMLYGVTLCGRSFPVDKGFYSPHKFCRRCVNKAYKMGFQKGFTKGLESVPTRRTDWD